MDIQENQGLKDGYALKLNSYDLGVDIELTDAVQRLRFEHPEVTCVVVTSAQEGMFFGRKYLHVGKLYHAFKVGYCKFTNEARLYIEDATENSEDLHRGLEWYGLRQWLRASFGLQGILS